MNKTVRVCDLDTPTAMWAFSQEMLTPFPIGRAEGPCLRKK